MSVDKLVDSTQLDSDLTSVANAIRTKGGTSASLAFPAGFVSAINAISGGGANITGFVSEKVINTTEGVTSGSNNSFALLKTLEPELETAGNRAFYIFFFLNNSLTNKRALFAWAVHQNDTAWMYGSCRMNNGGALAWIAQAPHDFWYSAGTEIHILKFNSQLGY